ncbi:MAG: M14 family metallopeptidase, partial [Planctomycetota bacterium]
TLPAVCWLGYSVHGNEISCTDAALLCAYHLAAAKEDELVQTILAETVVIIDPLQNPDGRDRFVHHFRQTRGRWPDAEPDSAEHNEPWPGGRTNHYLFDMNRDWFALTQPETRAKVKAFQQWWPVVFVDAHEMGYNSSYYFAPPAKPLNPEITTVQRHWLEQYGRNNARWFDRFGFDYFTREQFDAFYPGYGEGWPMFQGAIGMTYEQGSVRGLVVRREDETTIRYRESVQHHFIASLSTLETPARKRKDVLRAFLDYRRGPSSQADRDTRFYFPRRGDVPRLQKLMQKLADQGVEVCTLSSAVTVEAQSYTGSSSPVKLPPGSFMVSLDQPAGRLAKVLLTRQQDMEADFLAEQKRKHSQRKRTQFYDMTGWSLPLLYNVECYVGKRTGRTWSVAEASAFIAGPRAKVQRAKLAYVLPWNRNESARALAMLLRKEVRCRCADKPFTLAGRKFPAGSVVIKVKGNVDRLHDIVGEVLEACDVELIPTDSSWVDEGIHFGSSRMRFLKKPKVAMAWDRPTNAYSAGWTRYMLEQQYGYPVTLIRTRQLNRARLDRFNVLVLPSGSYGRELGEVGAKRIKAWVQAGGTLITMGGSTSWLTGKSVGLLATKTEDRRKPDKKKSDKKAPEEKQPATKPATRPAAAKPEPFDYEKAIQPDKERPGRTPGAILRTRLDPEHWLAFGYDGGTNVVTSSSRIYTPVKLDKGTNVVVYEKRDKLLLSGFSWAASLDQLAEKAYLVHQPHGRGHVVAFAEDPNFRAFADGLNLLFMNAVLLGPGH